MITFKSTEDLSRIPPEDPARTTVEEHIQQYISDPSYRPEEDGYLVLIERSDVDRVLSDLDLPWRLSEVPFEGVCMVHGHYHAVYLPNNQFALSFLVPDAEWLPDDLRRHLEAHL